MPPPKYQNLGPVAATSTFHLAHLAGKSVLITGGASGLGRAYAKAFVTAGAYVTIGDVNPVLGRQTAKELGGNAQFTPCDVRSWEDQVLLFESCVKNSPNRSCDIVIANAGIMRNRDELVSTKVDPNQAPRKPDLSILDVNLTGVLYTAHLAMHYCRRKGGDKNGDKCLVIVSSLAGYLDQRGAAQYCVAKNAGRAMMRILRQDAWVTGVRVNSIAPWVIYTDIISPGSRALMEANKLAPAEVEDAVKAILKIATDASVNGRSLGVLPREVAPEGYLDLDHDDLREDDLISKIDSKVTTTLEKERNARNRARARKTALGNPNSKL